MFMESSWVSLPKYRKSQNLSIYQALKLMFAFGTLILVLNNKDKKLSPLMLFLITQNKCLLPFLKRLH